MKFIQNTSLVIVSLLLSLFFLEALVRLSEQQISEIHLNENPRQHEDKILGWSGKKIFDAKSSKKRIFIIGDSFTEGNGVDEVDMYYSLLRDGLEADLFIYGGDGYGTLQELLVLKKYIDEIKPDLVIIQITSNDIMNNSVELEKKSYFNNGLLIRPYYIDDEIKMLYPSSFGSIRYQLVSNSRLFLRVFEKTDKIMAYLANKNVLTSIEDVIGEEGSLLQEYNQAELVTKKLFDEIILLSGEIPVVFMPVDDMEPYYSYYRKIVAEGNAYWAGDSAKNISERLSNNENVLQEDGAHWNVQGHLHAGQTLLKNLIEWNAINQASSLD